MKITVIISLIFVVIIVFLEIISGFLYKETDYDKITKILKEDSELIWVIKPNIETFFESTNISINSLGFRNPENVEKKKQRIIIMGPSSSFGWGIEREKTYAYLLEQKLKNYEVINASVIGYSSYQGRILFEKKIKNLKPDILIFAYGANDPDRYRFFRNETISDKDLKPKSQRIIEISEFLKKSKFLKLLSYFSIKMGVITYKINTIKRVDLNDFIENIEYFKKESVKSNFRLILLTTPFLKPSNYDDYLNCDESNIKNCLKLKNISLNNFKKIQEIQLSKIYDDIIMYNQEMKKYAAKNKINLIDLYNIFKLRNDFFLKPDKDMVHFSEKGHLEISEVLYKKIQK